MAQHRYQMLIQSLGQHHASVSEQYVDEMKVLASKVGDDVWTRVTAGLRGQTQCGQNDDAGRLCARMSPEEARRLADVLLKLCNDAGEE